MPLFSTPSTSKNSSTEPGSPQHPGCSHASAFGSQATASAPASASPSGGSCARSATAAVDAAAGRRRAV
eukprot:7388821-Prymnesium_polylepis.2